MKKIILIFCCFIFFFTAAEAKIYTNEEYKFSIWVPDGMNLYEDNSGNVQIFNGKANGISLMLMVSRDFNTEGESFNSLALTKEILQTNRECFEAAGFVVKTYYNNPCPNHYYPVTLNYSQERNFVSCGTQITIHGYSISMIANGSCQQVDAVHNIIKSFTCLQETGGL